MLMLPKKAAHLVKKTEKMRVFTPEQNTSADAYKFDYRIYYDLFVKASAADTVWAWISAPVTITHITEDFTTFVGNITEAVAVDAETVPGSMLQYQWYYCDNANGKGATKLIGSNAAICDLPMDLTEGKHYFFCKVTVDQTHTVKTDMITVTVE
jgi:hypothetical protein